MLETLLVPRERLGILKDKEVVETIEKTLNVKITLVDNSAEIEGDGLELYRAKNIVKAIARGFSSEHAFRLFDEEQVLEIIDLKGHTDKKNKVIKARLIGTGGKTRKAIEFFSKSSVCIYGNTICLIGNFEQLGVAREAVRRIVNGSKHNKVYSYLRDAEID